MKLCVALFVAFSLPTSNDFCGNFPPSGFDGPGRAKFTGRYYNFVYGYSVRIPKGLAGYNTAPPSPQHGFGVVLSWEPRSYVYFDGSYNSSEAKNAKEIEEAHLKWLEEKSAQVTGVERFNLHLGPLRARRYVARHTCKKVQGEFVEDTVIALYQGIVYSASLLTTQARYSQDRVILERMLRTWRLARRE
jgi:hypothetical protein